MSQWLSEKNYDFIFSQVPRVCVDVLIETDEGILCTLRDIEPSKGKWHLPGGRILFGESFEQAAHRIAQEEVGLAITTKEVLGCVEFINETQNGKPRHNISIVVSAKSASGATARNDWQAKKFGFFKVLPEPFLQPQAKFLKDHRLI